MNVKKQVGSTCTEGVGGKFTTVGPNAVVDRKPAKTEARGEIPRRGTVKSRRVMASQHTMVKGDEKSSMVVETCKLTRGESNEFCSTSLSGIPEVRVNSLQLIRRGAGKLRRITIGQLVTIMSVVVTLRGLSCYCFGQWNSSFGPLNTVINEDLLGQERGIYWLTNSVEMGATSPTLDCLTSLDVLITALHGDIEARQRCGQSTLQQLRPTVTKPGWDTSIRVVNGELPTLERRTLNPSLVLWLKLTQCCQADLVYWVLGDAFRRQVLLRLYTVRRRTHRWALNGNNGSWTNSDDVSLLELVLAFNQPRTPLEWVWFFVLAAQVVSPILMVVFLCFPWYECRGNHPFAFVNYKMPDCEIGWVLFVNWQLCCFVTGCMVLALFTGLSRRMRLYLTLLPTGLGLTLIGYWSYLRAPWVYFWILSSINTFAFSSEAVLRQFSRVLVKRTLVDVESQEPQANPNTVLRGDRVHFVPSGEVRAASLRSDRHLTQAARFNKPDGPVLGGAGDDDVETQVLMRGPRQSYGTLSGAVSDGQTEADGVEETKGDDPSPQPHAAADPEVVTGVEDFTGSSVGSEMTDVRTATRVRRRLWSQCDWGYVYSNAAGFFRMLFTPTNYSWSDILLHPWEATPLQAKPQFFMEDDYTVGTSIDNSRVVLFKMKCSLGDQYGHGVLYPGGIMTQLHVVENSLGKPKNLTYRGRTFAPTWFDGDKDLVVYGRAPEVVTPAAGTVFSRFLRSVLQWEPPDRTTQHHGLMGFPVGLDLPSSRRRGNWLDFTVQGLLTNWVGDT